MAELPGNNSKPLAAAMQGEEIKWILELHSGKVGGWTLASIEGSGAQFTL